MPTVLITGANRGLGLEFSHYYLKSSWNVLATCRSPKEALDLKALENEYGEIKIFSLDLASEKDIESLGMNLSGIPIDVLINNAGVYLDRGCTFGKLNYEDWSKSILINTLAPMKIAEVLLENLQVGEKKCLINITSRMGSIADNTSGGSYYYRSSKAALNAAMKTLSMDLLTFHITTVLFHPGWVKTDMGGPNASITPEESIKGMCNVIDKLTLKDSGKFLDYTGKELPW